MNTKQAYKKSVDDPEDFWGDIAENFTGEKNGIRYWNGILKNQEVEWFKGAKLNITENCIDVIWKNWAINLQSSGNPITPKNSIRILTYRDLYQKVCQFAQVLKNNGVKKGDRVCIYMGMVPELAYAVLGLCKNWCHSLCDIWWIFCAKYCRPVGGCQGRIYRYL